MKDDIIYINTDNCESPREGNSIYESRRNIVELSRTADDPLVSIMIVSYKRIDKTRNCVESVLKYTNNVDYELVLVENGSNDGTIDYFKSIKHEKKKIIQISKNLQLAYGIIQGTKQCTGKYICFLNDDIIVTENWLHNIIQCFNSDEKIGLVCACSSNASNLQDLGLSYSSIDEMFEKASNNNISDPTKWHERLRLLSFAATYRRECIEICGNWDYGFFHDFVDDDLTFHIRRSGYKTILCKDVYVYHDHDYSDMNTEKYEKFRNSLNKGKDNFIQKYFGIDAWDDASNYEINLLKMFKDSSNDYSKVLGIDVLCGTPILEIKNKLKSSGKFNTELSAFFEDAKYYIDLKTICDGEVICDRVEFINEYFPSNYFDYILIGKEINLYSEPFKLLLNALSMMSEEGQLLLKLKNTNDIVRQIEMMGFSVEDDNEYYVDWNYNDFCGYIDKLGYKINSVIYEQHKLATNSIEFVNNYCITNEINDEYRTRLTTERYLVSIVRK